MTAEQFFVEQAKFNKWLFDLTSDEAKHITSMLNEYAEAKAKEFAEWVNENYTLVTSEELQKSAWVNLKRSVYVNGSDFHYTQMINEFGETIEQLYKNYNQNG